MPAPKIIDWTNWDSVRTSLAPHLNAVEQPRQSPLLKRMIQELDVAPNFPMAAFAYLHLRPLGAQVKDLHRPAAKWMMLAVLLKDDKHMFSTTWWGPRGLAVPVDFRDTVCAPLIGSETDETVLLFDFLAVCAMTRGMDQRVHESWKSCFFNVPLTFTSQVVDVCVRVCLHCAVHGDWASILFARQGVVAGGAIATRPAPGPCGFRRFLNGVLPGLCGSLANGRFTWTLNTCLGTTGRSAENIVAFYHLYRRFDRRILAAEPTRLLQTVDLRCELVGQRTTSRNKHDLTRSPLHW